MLVFTIGSYVGETVFPFIVLFVWIFIETILLSTLGTTPGKFLLNIKLREADGTKLRFHKALLRSFSVWFFGLAMGIPLFNIITLILSYITLNSDRATRWDRKGKFLITAHKIGIIRKIVITLSILLVVAYITWLFYKISAIHQT